MPDAEIVISQPFWPAYMTAERIAKAKKLKMIVTAGIGSDHTDLQAAMDRNVTVAEVTYCNSNSVAEHVVMQMLSLVRNYIPSYNWVIKGGWNIADCVERSYDIEGILGASRPARNRPERRLIAPATAAVDALYRNEGFAKAFTARYVGGSRQSGAGCLLFGGLEYDSNSPRRCRARSHS